MQQSLLEKAKKFGVYTKGRKTFTDEEIGLAIAWANDEVSATQVKGVMFPDDKSLSSTLVFLAKCLKQYIKSQI